jgi:mycoredoxin
LTDSIIKVYATDWCWECRQARRQLERLRIPYEWVNIDHDKEAEEYVVQVNRGYRSVPTILFPDGSILVEPSDDELKNKLQEFPPQPVKKDE